MQKKFGQIVLVALVLALAIGTAAQAQTRDFEVTVYNLTKGQVMSPPLVVTHTSDVSLFTPGDAASDELAAIAEDAIYDGMLTLLEGLDGVQDFQMGGDVIPPGESMTITVEATREASYLSIVGMTVTTNDTFYAVNAKPLFNGTATYKAIGYDAGSEANTENCDHIPGPPCDNPEVRVTEGAEGSIYVSNGVHGVDDLVPADHDWRNPVGRISVSIVP